MTSAPATDDLSGRNAIVFGGTSGINLGIAEAFGRAGARVFVVSRDPAKVTAAIERLRAQGAEADGCCADVRDIDAVALAAARAAAPAGGIDIVVSGAAGNFLVSAEGLSPKGLRTVIDIDLIGTFHVAKACFEHLRRPGASIIAISAPQGAKAMADQLHACVAKAGVNMLTRCLALEWAPKGVRVNAISPGPIEDTEGMRRLAPTTEAARSIAEAVPMRRFGRIQEVADAACYLASARGGLRQRRRVGRGRRIDAGCRRDRLKRVPRAGPRFASLVTGGTAARVILLGACQAHLVHKQRGRPKR